MLVAAPSTPAKRMRLTPTSGARNEQSRSCARTLEFDEYSKATESVAVPQTLSDERDKLVESLKSTMFCPQRFAT